MSLIYNENIFIILFWVVCTLCIASSAANPTTTVVPKTTEAPTEEPLYAEYALEDICTAKETVYSLHIPGWSAAIITLGQTYDGEYDRSKESCRVKISTSKGFHLGAIVENIKIQGDQHSTTRRWMCEDYVQFSTKDAGFVNKVLDMLLPDQFFKGREGEELCGSRTLDTSETFRLIDTSSHSNMFTTLASSMQLEYRQETKLKTAVNNSFSVVVSTYKKITENECQGDQHLACGGVGQAAQYCVLQRYACDGHVNCAQSQGGGDERSCPTGKVAGLSQLSVVLSSTIVLLTAAGSVLGATVLLGILYTLIARARGESR